jgi:hypothetical protein
MLTVHRGGGLGGGAGVAFSTNGVDFSFYSLSAVKRYIQDGHQQVAHLTMAYSPAAVVFKGQTYLFFHTWSGPGWGRLPRPSGEVWYCRLLKLDGKTMVAASSDLQQVPNTGISSSPALTVFGGKLYLFHQGKSDSGGLWYNAFDGGSWAGDKSVDNVGISASPSAVVGDDGRLYVIHQGNLNTGQLWSTSADTNLNFSGDRRASNTVMSAGPGAIVQGDGSILCLHQGGSNSGQLWWNTLSQGSWTGDHWIGGSRMSDFPAVVSYGGKLHAYYQGAGNNGKLMHISRNLAGGDWSGESQISLQVSISDSPSAIVAPIPG